MWGRIKCFFDFHDGLRTGQLDDYHIFVAHAYVCRRCHKRYWRAQY